MTIQFCDGELVSHHSLRLGRLKTSGKPPLHGDQKNEDDRKRNIYNLHAFCLQRQSHRENKKNLQNINDEGTGVERCYSLQQTRARCVNLGRARAVHCGMRRLLTLPNFPKQQQSFKHGYTMYMCFNGSLLILIIEQMQSVAPTFSQQLQCISALHTCYSFLLIAETLQKCNVHDK